MFSWIRGLFLRRQPAAGRQSGPEAPECSTPAASPAAQPATMPATGAPRKPAAPVRSHGDSSLAPLIVAPWATVTFHAFSFSEKDRLEVELAQVEAGMVDLEEMMLGSMLEERTGRTLYQLMEERHLALPAGKSEGGNA